MLFLSMWEWTVPKKNEDTRKIIRKIKKAYRNVNSEEKQYYLLFNVACSIYPGKSYGHRIICDCSVGFSVK